VFAIQDEVTEQIAGTLGSYWGRVAQAMRERARRKPPENLAAYELYLLGFELKHRLTEESNIKAVEVLNKAIALDPDFARAYVALAWTHLNLAIYSWTDDPTGSMDKFAASARRAVELDDADAEAHLALGFALLYHDQQIESGNKEIERALVLGPSNADVHAIAAWGRSTKIGMAQAKADSALVKRAMRLNPHYPEWYLIALSYAAYHGHEYEEVVQAARQMVNPTLESYLYLALSLAELGQDSEAAVSAADLLRLDSDFSAERHINNDVFVDEAIIKHFIVSIEKAGLPVCATQEQLAKYPDMKRLEQCDAERARS
jgi:tetratricopeptide (TPR) repeat protein